MMKSQNKPWTLFFSMLMISAFTFGGGFVIVSLMKKKFVDELGWLTEEEMLDMTALAQSAPGPIALNAATFVGMRVAGLPGALAATFGCVLPSVLIVTLLSWLYQRFRSGKAISAATTGNPIKAVLEKTIMRRKVSPSRRPMPISFGIPMASRITRA